MTGNQIHWSEKLCPDYLNFVKKYRTKNEQQVMADRTMARLIRKKEEKKIKRRKKGAKKIRPFFPF